MAMSQFSVGAIASYRARGERLPVAGGYDADGRAHNDPAALEASKRLLPIGFWKGSGLSLVLDMVAALLSGGRATFQIPFEPEQETGLSQVFIAIGVPTDPAESAHLIDQILAHTQGPSPTEGPVRYPGNARWPRGNETSKMAFPCSRRFGMKCARSEAGRGYAIGFSTTRVAGTRLETTGDKAGSRRLAARIASSSSTPASTSSDTS